MEVQDDYDPNERFKLSDDQDDILEKFKIKDEINISESMDKIKNNPVEKPASIKEKQATPKETVEKQGVNQRVEVEHQGYIDIEKRRKEEEALNKYIENDLKRQENEKKLVYPSQFEKINLNKYKKTIKKESNENNNQITDEKPAKKSKNENIDKNTNKQNNNNKGRDKKVKSFLKKFLSSNKKSKKKNVNLEFSDKVNFEKEEIKGCLYCNDQEDFELKEFKPQNKNKWRLLNRKKDKFYYGICKDCLNDPERLEVPDKIKEEENNYLSKFKVI